MSNGAINVKRNGPRITIIVAVYNGAATLQKCLDSIHSQTYQNRELIIMDGGSVDGTVEILKKQSHRIYFWESTSDRGIYHALNKALMHSTGDWIYILGSDDVLHDEHVFERFAMQISDVAPEPLIAYGKIEYCRGRNRRTTGESWERTRRKLYSGMYIPHQGIFHNRKLFEICGNFDERYKVAGDYHLLLRSLRYCTPVFLEKFIVADQYAGGKSGERASRWKVLKEFRAAQKDVGFNLTLRWICEFTKAQIWRCIYAALRVAHVYSLKKCVYGL